MPPCCAGLTRPGANERHLPDFDPVAGATAPAGSAVGGLSARFPCRRRADGSGRCAQHRGRGRNTSRPRHRRHRPGRRFSPRVVDASSRYSPKTPASAKPAHLGDVGRSDAGIRSAESGMIPGEPARVGRQRIAADPSARLRGYLSRTLHSIERRGPARSAYRSADIGGVQPRPRNRRPSNAGARRRLSVARFAFDPAHERARLDGARILSRLMRQMDFGAVQNDGSIFRRGVRETDLRTAHMIARRFQRDAATPRTATRRARRAGCHAGDDVAMGFGGRSLLARLYGDARRRGVLKPGTRHCNDADIGSRRLAVLGEVGELAQDSWCGQTFLRRLPFLEEHHLHVGRTFAA